jgi:hypothetical protein
VYQAHLESGNVGVHTDVERPAIGNDWNMKVCRNAFDHTMLLISHGLARTLQKQTKNENGFFYIYTYKKPISEPAR